jgi:hypothetical protein
MKASIEGVQILGGYGYCREYPMERHMRDAWGASSVRAKSRHISWIIFCSSVNPKSIIEASKDAERGAHSVKTKNHKSRFIG